jgi:urease accessory protein
MPTITTEGALPLLRLLHLASPSLPVGAFAYSQGIEWAAETGWIRTAQDLEGWLDDQLRHALARVDLPLLVRMQAAAGARDPAAMSGWVDWLLACRESAELRLEEASRGRALADLLVSWGMLDPGQESGDADRAGPLLSPQTLSPLGRGARCRGDCKAADGTQWRPVIARSQAAGFAFAATAWAVPIRDALLGYAWAWLENLVLAGVKIIPLGQTQGQRILQRLVPEIPALAARALALQDDAIGASTPALAIASSAHETQYTRLFRS